MRGWEQAVDTTRDKFFPLTPWVVAVRSKPVTLVQWVMKFETQGRGGGTPASPQALVPSAHRCWVPLPEPLHSLHPCGRNQQRFSLT